ncbi:MAG: DUF937 domain-containing protein [Gammaproteobacteria bacterium]|nr:DUF937 domain-containing protein [Gammaproteobacteria bacterium]
MNLIDLLMGEQNKDTISQIARQFDLSEEQTRGAIGQLLPSLQRGVQHNTSDEKGLDELLAAIEKGNHGRYLDEPSILGQQQTTDDGNSILGHIFGSKDVSRRVASNAAEQTGLSSGLMKKLLPIVASIAMGAMSKQIFGGGNSSATRRAAPTQSRGIVASMLDSDNDGSVIDDILGMAFKAMR